MGELTRWARLARALALVAACGDGGSAAGPAEAAPDAPRAAPETVSYSRDLKPLLLARCGICHSSTTVAGYSVADPFDTTHGLVNRPNSWASGHDTPFDLVVKPGAPDASFLIYKVATDPAEFDPSNDGNPMPLAVPRVTDQELADIKQWIADGALNDTFFREKVGPVFGTAVALGRKQGKCTLCHYPGSSTGLDILAVFDDQDGLVGAKSVLSKKLRVAPGQPGESFLVEKIEQAKPSAGAQMPLHYPRLSADEVEVIRTWIAEGAKNN